MSAKEKKTARSQRPAASAKPGKAPVAGKLVVATFNVNSVRSRLPVVTAWLERNQPDVLCMQETKVVDADFPREPFEKLGYHLEVFGQKSYNGVAIASREPLEDVARGLGDGEKDEPARLIRGRIRGVLVVNTYVPQGREMGTEHFEYKLKWLARLRKFFERECSPDQPILWCGDMNVAPTELDLHDPKHNDDHVCFAPVVREALANVAAWGFEDIFRRHHKEPGQYSFYDYRVVDSVKRGLGWRVDLLMATAPMAAKSTDAWIDLAPRIGEKPSDHCPAVAEFGI